MQSPTHALIGIGAGLLIAAHYQVSPADSFAMAVLSGIAALLPDIDHPNSVIRNRLGIAGDVAAGWLKHRGITHSFAALAIVTLVSGFIFPAGHVSILITLGYASHLLADMITPAGIPLFAPVTWKMIKLPLVRTGSLIEWALRAGLVFAVLWLIDWRW